MGELREVARLADLPVGGVVSVPFEGDQVAIFNVDGELHAIADVCPHAAAPLSDGKLEHGRVRCKWHGALFELATGELIEGPGSAVPTYRVEVDGDRILLEVPETRPWTAAPRSEGDGR